jgi:phosphocarrier protein
MKAGPVTITIVNRRGLHARASARLVGVATRFNATLWVSKDDNEVTGTSIMGLMMLGAAMGDTVDIRAEGAEAVAALTAVVELIETRFGED